MQQPEIDSSQDVVDALGITVERTTRTGERWCPPADGERLRRIVMKRGEKLGHLIQQAMRLLRLMQRADPRGYEYFLYAGFWPLQERQFALRLRKAFDVGRLQGIARLEANGSVTFLEREMNSGETRFNLSFTQMPLIAAGIDAIGNMLGHQLGVRCADLMQPACRRSALDVGKEISAAVLDWLHPRLAPQHHLRQQAHVRTYHREMLEARGVTRAPRHDDVDDGFIADFWISCGSTLDIDGFKLFRNSARKAVRYRSALREAEAERSVLGARSILVSKSDEDAPGTIDPDRLAMPASDDDGPAHANPLAETREDWTSPFEVLLAPPCDRVKWLSSGTGPADTKGGKKKKRKGRDVLVLRQLVGESDRDEASPVAPSIFFQEPPDPRFFRTVLRFSCFGDMQRRLAGAGEDDDEDGAVPADYARLADWYGGTAADIRTTIGAAAWSLMKRGSGKGALLARYLEPAGNGATRDLELARCYKNVERQGFRQKYADDLADPAYGEALEEGAASVVILHRCASHFVDWCRRHDLARLFEEDLAVFAPRLREMYCKEETAEHPAARIRCGAHLSPGGS